MEECFNYIFDRKILLKLKEKFHRIMVRPKMYGEEYWAVKSQQKHKLIVVVL